MAITLAQTVNGVTTTWSLPDPMQNGYTMAYGQWGKAHRMASGALVRERTNTSLLRQITIEWTYITATQRSVVDAAVTAMLDGSSATLTNPLEAGTYTVVLGERDLPEWKVTRVRHGGTASYRFSGKLVLEQVP